MIRRAPKPASLGAFSPAFLGAALLLAGAPAQADDELSGGGFTLTQEEAAVALTAAGFHLEPDGWHACDDPGTPGWEGGRIGEIRDLDGDGQPEAVISEGSAYCYGGAGQGYFLVSRQDGGDWKLMTSGIGIPAFLDTRGVDNWPDMEVGGPGFCFPVLRWNGTDYVPNRNEYEGKPC